MIADDTMMYDVFAKFGLTYHSGESLFRGLALYYLFSNFQSFNDITLPRLKEREAEIFKLTFGVLLQETKPYLTNEIYNKLNLAVEKRNYLAHHFWYESAYDIYTVEGIEKCLKELDEIDNLFSTLDYEIVKMFDAHKSKLGISDEMLEQQMRLGIAGNIPPPAPTKPKLKKQIKIIQAYNVEVTSELVGMIFETDEGELLQFCDVGLGYSYLEKGKGKWVPNNKLTEHLPFQVNPRPKVTSAWNFELQIKKDTVLWVTRGSKDRTFRWGIRKDK